MLYCTDLSLSFTFRATHMKLLPRTVSMEANSLSGKLKTGFQISVFLSSHMLMAFLQHIQLRNYRTQCSKQTMSHRWIMTLHQTKSVCACVTACAYRYVCVQLSACSYIYIWLANASRNELQTLRKHILYIWKFQICNISPRKGVTSSVTSR